MSGDGGIIDGLRHCPIDACMPRFAPSSILYTRLAIVIIIDLICKIMLKRLSR